MKVFIKFSDLKVLLVWNFSKLSIILFWFFVNLITPIQDYIYIYKLSRIIPNQYNIKGLNIKKNWATKIKKKKKSKTKRRRREVILCESTMISLVICNTCLIIFSFFLIYVCVFYRWLLLLPLMFFLIPLLHLNTYLSTPLFVLHQTHLHIFSNYLTSKTLT